MVPSDRSPLHEDLQTALTRVATSVGMHLYHMVRGDDGEYTCTAFIGAGLESVLGPLPAGVDPEAAWDAAVHPDDRERYDRIYAEIERTREPVEIEYRLISTDGVTRWVWDRMHPLTAPDGSLEIDGVVVDVTERRQTEEHLAEVQLRLSAALDTITDVVFTLGGLESTPELIFLGPGLERLLGLPVTRDDALAAWRAAIHDDDRSAYDQFRDRILRAEAAETEVRVVDAAGGTRWVWIRGRPRRQPGGAIVVDGVATEVTEQRLLTQELQHLAYHDSLTGLANRPLFREQVETALARGARRGDPVAVLYVDLDGFKLVNDRHGHAVGDAVLVEAAARLRGVVRAGDVAARLGGDEFGVVVDCAEGEDAAVAVAERAIAAFAAPFRCEGERIALRPSIGIAVSAPGELEVDELLRRADVAMYDAKRAGRGGYRRYDGAVELRLSEGRADAARSDERREIEELLATPGALRPAFQPVVDLRTGLVAGYEALTRFAGAARRSPADWFMQARRVGLDAALESAALAAQLACPGRPASAYLSLNVSPAVLVGHESELPLPDRLDGIVIEVTENELVTEGPQLEAVLARLRERGALIAVDDAGAGYAGFGQLIRLRPDIVKLDRSVVSGIDVDPMKAALVESFVRFAARTGAVVCAEGVETLAELRALADLDVTYGQGWAFARPAPAYEGIDPEAARVCSAALAEALRTEGGAGARPATADWQLENLVDGISRAADLRDLGPIMDRVAGELAADEAYLSEIDMTGTAVSTVAACKGQAIGLTYPLAAYPATRHVLETQEALQVLVDDPHADPAEVALLREDGFASALLVPVMASGRALGLLEVYSTTARPWSRSEICRARMIAYALGAALRDLDDSAGLELARRRPAA